MDNIPEDKALIVMGYEKVSMQEFLIELQKNQGIVLRTCQQLKMDRHTFYNWYDKDPWFK